MTKDLLVESAIATIVGDPDTTPMSVRHPTKEEKIPQEEGAKEKNHHQERGGVEMIDKFIIKKILRALDGKYDAVCTLIQMMPNYKDLKPTEVIGRIVAHEMSLKDKEELHNKSSGAYKASCEAPHYEVRNKPSMKN